MKIDKPTPPRMILVASVLMLAQVSVVKAIATGHFEVRSLLVPSLGFGTMFWLAMSTLSKRGQIHRLLLRHGLIRQQKR